jgi:class 3 adenylate cyclase
LLTLEALSVEITAQVAHNDDHQYWPLVRILDFAAMGWTARQQMKAETVGLIPVVTGSNRESWEAYAIQNQGWIDDARSWEMAKEEILSSTSRSRTLKGVHSEMRLDQSSSTDRKSSLVERELSKNGNEESEEVDFSTGIANKIFTYSDTGESIVDQGFGPFAPIWMTSPAPPKESSINFNLLSHPLFWDAIESVIGSELAVLGKVLNFGETHKKVSGPASTLAEDPISAFYYPVFDENSDNGSLVGILASEIVWTHFFENLLPNDINGVICVIENSCRQIFTYRIDGAQATFLGSGDLHDSAFDYLVESRGVSYLVDLPENFAALPLDFEHCPFDIHVYPSADLHREYLSLEPALFAFSTIVLLSLATVLFYGRKNKKEFPDKNSIVVVERNFSHLPTNKSLQERFFKLLRPSRTEIMPKEDIPHFKATLRTLTDQFKNNNKNNSVSNATVMFADIVGLEKWGTKKNAEETNTLAEKVYLILKTIAKQHGIDQIERRKDSIVAVAGPHKLLNDHASVMVSFADDCRNKAIELFRKIPAEELSMRFGIHSGFLESSSEEANDSRYKLIGDTIDTACQILLSGKGNKIQVSVDTAELLNLAGKSRWIQQRKQILKMKGRESLHTYWIKTKVLNSESSIDLLDTCDMSVVSESAFGEVDLWDEQAVVTETASNIALSNLESRFQSIVDRNVTALLGYLKKIHAKRIVMAKFSQRPPEGNETDIFIGDPIIEETRQVIAMPNFEPKVAANMINSDLIFISEEIESELRLYVSSIASNYKSNAFHNFEHATHVAISMDKMLQKISMPSNADKNYLGFNGKRTTAEELASELDSRSFGIASDPLTEFSLMLSALIHDVDHTGISNYQLIKEACPIADLYKNKSVAEQNSVDIAWWLLMTPNFSALRKAIFSDATEKRRFRQVFVNSVIATDILDRDLKVHIDRRWDKAFRKNKIAKIPETVRLKEVQATAVIEHVMQACDFAHTMQHFRTYLKWSERLFGEMFQAYHDGRAEKDPSVSWFKGELAFFDKFVIPLAKRLRDCGVLGEFGNDYLEHAKENRQLWAERGKGVVQKMLEDFNRKIIASQEDTVVFS